MVLTIIVHVLCQVIHQNCGHWQIGIILGIGEATFWEDMKVRLPVPVESTLECMYGKNWRHPFPKYRWDLDPFLTGYCHY